MKTKCAKAIRILTAPPLMAILLFVLLRIERREFFVTSFDFMAAMIGLVLIPLMAYPLQHYIPALKEKGRKAQRKLAFILSVAGYLFFVLYALTQGVSPQIRRIAVFYAISVLILTIINKATVIRASGHSCSFSAMPIWLARYVSYLYIIPGTILGTAVIWSSLQLKRHTISELIYGIGVAAVSYGLTYLIFDV